MASHRDTAFQTFYDSLPDKGGISGEALLRKAWEAGRRYEAERLEAIASWKPRSHNDDCTGCGSEADNARIRGHVAGGFGAMAVADTIRKGGTVEIPSLGITLTKRDLQKDDDSEDD